MNTVKETNRIEKALNGAKTPKSPSSIKVAPIIQRTLTFNIIGTSPMIQHAWSEKGLSQMRMTSAERRKQPKEARNPEQLADAATYRTDSGEYGLPVLALKSAIISAAHKDLGVEKTLVKKALFIPCKDSNKCVPLICSEPICREDVVRVGMGATDLRYRPEFADWGAKICVSFDAGMLTSEDIINLINRAGFSIGIGEWRPEKGGEYGRFEVDSTQPVTEGR